MLTFVAWLADAESIFTGVWLAVVVVVGLALLALFIAGVVSVLRSPRLTTTGRALWILGMLVFPLLGPLAWFVFGRRSNATIYR